MGTQPFPETKSAEAPYYVWEPAGKPVSIHLHFDVIDQILPEVMRGFGALPRRGAEVGGLLLGRVDDGPRGSVVSITGAEPVSCEYLMGPSYHLSDRDRGNLEGALERHGGAVAGFFRSHTRKDLCLDDADAALLARYFAGPQNAFLLVKPFATRTSLAGFFFWEDGQIQRDASYQEFPFHRGDLGGGEPKVGLGRRVAPPRPQVPVFAQPLEPEAPTPTPDQTTTQDLVAPERRQAMRPVAFAVTGEYPPLQTEQPPALRQPERLRLPSSPLSILSQPPMLPAAESRRLRLGWWFWAPIAMTILVMAGTAGFVVSKTLIPAPMRAADATLPLKLLVNEHPTLSYLEIAWDRSSPAVLAARQGILTIQDGAHKRELQLSGDELRGGRVRYSRLTGDVALRLDVASDRDTVSETMRIVTGEPAPRAVAPDPAAQATPPPQNLQPEAPKGVDVAPATADPTVVPASPVLKPAATEGRKRPRVRTSRKTVPAPPPAETLVQPAPPTVELQAQPAPPTVTPAVTEPPPGEELPRPARRR